MGCYGERHHFEWSNNLPPHFSSGLGRGLAEDGVFQIHGAPPSPSQSIMPCQGTPLPQCGTLHTDPGKERGL